MLRRIQNRVAQVGIVHQHLRSARQLQLRSIHPSKIWPAGRRAAGVARVAAHARKQPLAILRQRHAAGRLLRPLLVVVRRQRGYLADHHRVVRPAVLRAEDMIRSRSRRVEPDRRIASRNYLTLHAEVGDGEAVKHILRDHRQLHRPANRHMQRIDLMLSTRMLRLPHPLLADDIDVHRVGRRIVDPEVQQRAPDKDDQEQRQRNNRPGRLEQRRAFHLDGDRVLLLAIPNREAEDENSHQRQADHREQQQEEVERVSVRRNGRRLARKERGSVEPFHQKLPQDWTDMHRYPLSVSFLVRSCSRASLTSFRNIRNMNPPNPATVIIPPTCTTRATINECLLVCGS